MDYLNTQRHGFVTFWLWLMIAGNAAAAIFNFFQSNYAIWVYATEGNAQLFFYVRHNMANFYSYGMIGLGVLGLMYVVSAVLLLKWRKLGFWLFISGGIVTTILMISFALTGGITAAVIQTMVGSILGSVILWAILQIKKNEVSCWSKLK